MNTDKNRTTLQHPGTDGIMPRDAYVPDYHGHLALLARDLMFWERCEYIGNDEIYSTEYRFRSLHKLLQNEPQFRHAIAKAMNCESVSSTGWNWEPLNYNNALSIGILTVFRDQPIPLHNHPDTCGMQLVLSGKVHIENYTSIEDSDFNTILKRDNRYERVFCAGDIASYQIRGGNIHGMTSLTEKSILLAIATPDYRQDQRNWYFPYEESPLADKPIMTDKVSFA